MAMILTVEPQEDPIGLGLEGSSLKEPKSSRYAAAVREKAGRLGAEYREGLDCKEVLGLNGTASNLEDHLLAQIEILAGAAMKERDSDKSVEPASTFRNSARKLKESAGYLQDFAKNGIGNLSEEQERQRQEIVKTVRDMVDNYSNMSASQKLMVAPLMVALSPLIILAMIVAPEAFQSQEQGKGGVEQGRGASSPFSGFGGFPNIVAAPTKTDYQAFIDSGFDPKSMPKGYKREYFKDLMEKPAEERASIGKQHGIGYGLLNPNIPEDREFRKSLEKRGLLEVSPIEDLEYEDLEIWGTDSDGKSWEREVGNYNRVMEMWGEHGYAKEGDPMGNAKAFHDMADEAKAGKLDDCGQTVGNFQGRVGEKHLDREAKSLVQHMVNEGAITEDEIVSEPGRTARGWLEEQGISLQDEKGNHRPFEDIKADVDRVTSERTGVGQDNPGKDNPGKDNPFAGMLQDAGIGIGVQGMSYKGDVEAGTNVSASAGVGTTVSATQLGL